MSSPLITETIDQPTCWVCSKTFFPEGEDASVIRNDHHVIPRAFGGSDGPTVPLCSADHDLLHLIAQKVTSGKMQEAQALLNRVPIAHRERLLYLTTRVVIAYNALNDDPNKQKVVTLRLTGQLSERLDRLASFFSCSREKVLIRLIDHQYSSVFQEPIRK